MYTKEEEIIHFIFKAFEGKKRIKEDIPLVFHSIEVGIMLKNINAKRKIVYTGYLHDLIEDTSVTYDEIKDKFGKLLADNVFLVSENKDIKGYRARKEEFIKRLENASADIILVELADKLHNLISDYNLYLTDGKKVINTEAPGYEDVKWYYLSLQDLFNKKLSNNELLDRYNKIIDIYF